MNVHPGKFRKTGIVLFFLKEKDCFLFKMGDGFKHTEKFSYHTKKNLKHIWV